MIEAVGGIKEIGKQAPRLNVLLKVTFLSVSNTLFIGDGQQRCLITFRIYIPIGRYNIISIG